MITGKKAYIEFAKLTDADEISLISRDEVEYGLGWNYTPQKITRIIKDKSKNIVVARINRNLVGFGVMTYHKDQANLDLLAVKKEFRRMKIATQIVLWLEKVAFTTGAFNIFVQVREFNVGAIEFYEQLGFQKLEHDEGYYKAVETAVIMAKMLRPMFYVT